MSYGWLFENPVDDISDGNHINLEHLPPELKQVALQIVQNQIDRDTAEKKLAELIQQLEFDITAAELGNDSNLLIVFYVQIVPDDFVMQLHRF